MGYLIFPDHAKLYGLLRRVGRGCSGTKDVDANLQLDIDSEERCSSKVSRIWSEIEWKFELQARDDFLECTKRRNLLQVHPPPRHLNWGGNMRKLANREKLTSVSPLYPTSPVGWECLLIAQLLDACSSVAQEWENAFFPQYAACLSMPHLQNLRCGWHYGQWHAWQHWHRAIELVSTNTSAILTQTLEVYNLNFIWHDKIIETSVGLHVSFYDVSLL